MVFKSWWCAWKGELAYKPGSSVTMRFLLALALIGASQVWRTLSTLHVIGYYGLCRYLLEFQIWKWNLDLISFSVWHVPVCRHGSSSWKIANGEASLELSLVERVVPLSEMLLDQLLVEIYSSIFLNWVFSRFCSWRWWQPCRSWRSSCWSSWWWKCWSSSWQCLGKPCFRWIGVLWTQWMTKGILKTFFIH